MNRIVLCSGLIVGCSRSIERQVHSVDSLEVRWSNGDDEQEDAVAEMLQTGDAQLAIEFQAASSGDVQTITLWQASGSDGGDLTLVDPLGSSTEGWSGGLDGDGTFRYSVFISIDSIELGELTLLTPNGVWLTGEREESGIIGDLRFDEPEEWGGWGSGFADLLVDVFLDVLFGTLDDSSTIEVDEAIDISGISFRIDYELALIESE